VAVDRPDGLLRRRGIRLVAGRCGADAQAPDAKDLFGLAQPGLGLGVAFAIVGGARSTLVISACRRAISASSLSAREFVRTRANLLGK